MELQAPIVAVTVYPQRARVTRRGRISLPAGRSDVVVADLTRTLLQDSIRVAVDGARVVGVDVVRRDLAEVPDDRSRAAEAGVRDAERALAAVDGADAGDAAHEDMLRRLALRSGDRLAAALADGSAEPVRAGQIGMAVSAQIAAVAARRRAHAEARVDAEHVLAAARAELDRLRSSGRTRREAVVGIEADAAGEVDVELTYVTNGAGWTSAYDARLDDRPDPPRASSVGPSIPHEGRIVLTWFGMVTQQTGEDWPACELTLSTARPAVTTTLPELEPWWIDVARPVARLEMAVAAAGPMPPAAAARGGAPRAVEAVPEEGLVAGSWRLARPTAVAADGTPHRTTVTTVEADARLDHLTAPVLGPDVHLRATVVNPSGHVLPAGSVSTFLAGAYVGTTTLPTTAPDGEIELALGVDDRVVVERELESRTAHKARFGSQRGAVQRWRTTVTNRRNAEARVVVRDRLPVSRAVEVKVVDVELVPEPAERDDLGRVEWVARIPAGGSWEVAVRYGVEHPKDVDVTGYR
jgi:uncharacterized protein (TIGR02231 family)